MEVLDNWLETPDGISGRRKLKLTGKWHFGRMEVVKFTLKPDRGKMPQRMYLVGHPFEPIDLQEEKYGTINKVLDR